MQLFVYSHNLEETVDLHKCILMLNLSTEQFAAFVAQATSKLSKLKSTSLAMGPDVLSAANI